MQAKRILIIDNAAFHSTKDLKLPENIILVPIPPYCPELNPAELKCGSGSKVGWL